MISDSGPSRKWAALPLAAGGLGIGILVVWFSGGFSARGGKAEDPLLRSILENLGRGVILPGYRTLAADAGRLRAAAQAFEREPDPARLEAVRTAWRAARRSWNVCEAHLVGPESRRLLRAKVDTIPPLTAKIEEIVLGVEEIGDGFAERLGSNRKGFAAIEYLCFDGDGPPSLEALTKGPNAGRRRRLLSVLASNLEATAAEIRDGWEPDKGNHLEAFLQGRANPADPPSAKASIDLLVNHLVSFTEFVKEARLAKPMGRGPGTSGVRRPELVESRRSGNSIEDLLNDLRGIRALYTGDDGLSAGVMRTNPDTHRAITAALDQALADASAIRSPLDRAIVARDESALKALASLVELHLRVASDLPAVYRTRVTVMRFDGD